METANHVLLIAGPSILLHIAPTSEMAVVASGSGPNRRANPVQGCPKATKEWSACWVPWMG